MGLALLVGWLVLVGFGCSRFVRCVWRFAFVLCGGCWYLCCGWVWFDCLVFDAIICYLVFWVGVWFGFVFVGLMFA